MQKSESPQVYSLPYKSETKTILSSSQDTLIISLKSGLTSSILLLTISGVISTLSIVT